jgi:hypothetical protein
MPMSPKPDELEPFKEICRKICLNIPADSHWQWDDQRNMAMMVLDGDAAELVFLPLIKEFRHHLDFSAVSQDSPSACRSINAQFGFMPGQVLFTSYPLCGLILCVAWWPWGQEQKVSMRIGLLPDGRIAMPNEIAQQCLTRWLRIAASTP